MQHLIHRKVSNAGQVVLLIVIELGKSAELGAEGLESRSSLVLILLIGEETLVARVELLLLLKREFSLVELSLIPLEDAVLQASHLKLGLASECARLCHPAHENTFVGVGLDH